MYENSETSNQLSSTFFENIHTLYLKTSIAIRSNQDEVVKNMWEWEIKT